MHQHTGNSRQGGSKCTETPEELWSPCIYNVLTSMCQKCYHSQKQKHSLSEIWLENKDSDTVREFIQQPYSSRVSGTVIRFLPIFSPNCSPDKSRPPASNFLKKIMTSTYWIFFKCCSCCTSGQCNILRETHYLLLLAHRCPHLTNVTVIYRGESSGNFVPLAPWSWLWHLQESHMVSQW